MKEPEPPSALTLRDIARQAGVSLATVDRVLHNRPGVRPDTVRRVKDAIERNASRMWLRQSSPTAELGASPS